MSALAPPVGVEVRRGERAWVRRGSLLLALALLAGSWGYLLTTQTAGATVLLRPETWDRVRDFLGALVGLDTPMTPGGSAVPFLDPAAWARMAGLAYETVAMSVLAIWIAAAGMLLTVMAGARPRRAQADAGPVRLGVFVLVRAMWIIARAVPELVWAFMLVIVLPPGLLVGALALGLHNFGIVSKLCAEVVEDIDPAPARALRAAGASRAQALLYGILPQALPQFLTFSLYRWEVIIRTTIVVGFVSAGGLGREFRLAMSFFHFPEVLMVLGTYFVLVIAVDLAAAQLRRLAR
ncbi:MAG: PhnE/PtxC family ABC transporter permease [Dehalococcoidia bacterium]